MRRHTFGKRPVRGCRKVNRTARGLLVKKIFEQRHVVRQVRHIERHRAGHVLFKRGFALCQPARNAHQRLRILPCERKHRIDKGIGPDESSVQVDTKNGLGIWSRHGRPDRHRDAVCASLHRPKILRVTVSACDLETFV